MAWQSGRQAPLASQIEIRQSEQDVQLGVLLFQTSVSGFSVTEQILHNAKDMLHLGADGRFLLFPTFDLSAATGAVVLILRRPAVDFVLYLLAVLVPHNRVLPFLRSNISAVPVDALLLAVKKFGRHAYVADVRGGGFRRVNQTAVLVHADMRFVAKMPRIALFPRMSLRVTLLFPVFCGRGRLYKRWNPRWSPS